jgi:hypothetical protein
MVERPIERPQSMSEGDPSRSSRRGEGSMLGARRIIAGALDLDTARLVSDAFNFGHLPGSGVIHSVYEERCSKKHLPSNSLHS